MSKDLLANPNIERDHRIAIDATGVGARRSSIPPRKQCKSEPVAGFNHGGAAITVHHGINHIPNRALLSNLQLLSQNRELI